MKSVLGRARRSGGFTIIELTITLGVMAILAVFAARYLADEAERQVSTATGLYQTVLGKGLMSYLIQNNADLAAGTPVAGYANPLAPTIPELKASGRLPASFPLRTPFGQAMVMRVDRVACPGATCRLDVLAYTAAPLVDNGGVAKYKTALDIRAATEGGVSADVANPAVLLGPLVGAGGIANPLGAVPGVYGVFASLDSALYPDYVKRFDSRSTQLNGDLTLSPGGVNPLALTVNGRSRLVGDVEITGKQNLTDDLTVGPVGTPCFTATPTGTVTVGCTGRLNAVSGVFSSGGDAVQINVGTPGSLLATGLVTGQAGLATNTGELFTAADPNGIRVKGSTVMELGYANGGGPVTMATVSNGDVAAAKNVSGMRVSLRETVALGAACAGTSEAVGAGAEMAALVGGGLAVCQGGVWAAVQNFATHQAACTVDGSTGVDPASNKTLVCKGGRWVWVNSFLSNFVMVRTINVIDGRTTVPATRYAKPTCDATGASGTGTPLLLLVPSNESTNDQTFNRWAIDIAGVPGEWEIRLENATSVPLAGASSIGMIYCWYP